MKVAMVSRYHGLGDYSLHVSEALRSEVFLLCESDIEQRSFHNVHLVPCWRRKSFLSDIARSVSRLRPDIVCVQHEVFLFGSVLSAILMPLLLILFRLRRIPIVLTMHGVIPRPLFTAEFLKDAGLPAHPRLARGLYRLLVNGILALSDVVLVTDNWLEKELKRYAPSFGSKIAVLALGVPCDLPTLDAKSAKLALGLDKEKNVALFLGYLAFYKGLETLFEAAKILLGQGHEWTVLVAGGQPYRTGTNGSADETEWIRHDSLPGNVRFAGFVPEAHLPLYLSAADVIVFPHKYLIASSGPLSMAVGVGKPILLSNEFARIIPYPEPIFGSAPADLARRIAASTHDEGLTRACRALAVDWRGQRNWDAVSRTYARICEQALRRRSTLASAE